MFALENLPVLYLQVGRLFVKKGEPAELGLMEEASDILGSFIMKFALVSERRIPRSEKVLKYNPFSPYKRPKFSNVLTITSA